MKARFRIDYEEKKVKVYVDGKYVKWFSFKDEWDLERKIRKNLIEIRQKYAPIKLAKIIEREYEI